MGSSGEKRKGREHLPKVGTAEQREMSQEREAVEENLGILPGGIVAKVLGALVVIAVIVAVLALVALD